MKLLHNEIDVVPGRKPQKQPLPEGYVGQGVAVLRLTNTSARQNSYTVRVKCDAPYWQDSWVRVMALTSNGDQNAAPAGKPDQPGPREQSMTLFVKDRGVRDVVLNFFVPEKSECRAGIYPVKIVVETRIVSDDPRQARKERIVEIPATVIVRPFYEWTVTYAPEERRVGIFRRAAAYEMVVENTGNDWLYVEMKLPRPQQALVDSLAQTIAVPPPEPGLTSVRSVPFRVVSRLRAVRGPVQATPLPLQLERVDAPSIAPLPEESVYAPGPANAGGAVVSTDSGELASTTPAKIAYCPPIPDSFTSLVEATVRNARGLVALLIGGVVAWQLAAYSYEVYFKRITDVRSSRSQVGLGEPFRINGRNLTGSEILVFDAGTKQPIGEPVEPKVTPSSLSENYVMVTLNDPTLDGKRVLIGAKRLGKLTFLSPYLPVVKDPTSIMIGKPPAPVVGPASGSVAATVMPGASFAIGGVNFGAKAGKVLIDGVAVKVTGWSNESIKLKVPAGKVGGDTFSIAAFTADGKSIAITPSTVSIPKPEEPVVDIADGGPDGEPQIDANGNPVETTSGGGGTDGGGGTTGTTVPPVQPVATEDLPSAYRLLMSNRRSDYLAAVRQTSSDRTPGGYAVKSFAYAALGRADDAQTAARQALKAIGNRQKGRDLGLTLLAMSRLVESVNPSQAKVGYAEADAQLEDVAPGFVFKDIVIARYKIASKSPFEAKIILRDALKKDPSSEERAAIVSLQKQVGE